MDEIYRVLLDYNIEIITDFSLNVKSVIAHNSEIILNAYYHGRIEEDDLLALLSLANDDELYEISQSLQNVLDIINKDY